MMNWKNWPWSRETRDSSYTDTLIQTIVNQASGATLAQPAATGALEACASIIARCFAAATVKGPDVFMKALGPGVLSHVARALDTARGKPCYLWIVRDGRLSLMPCAYWDVDGDAEPETWRYRLTVPGPDRYTTLESVPATGVIHVRYMTDPGAPVAGRGSVAIAAIAGGSVPKWGKR